MPYLAAAGGDRHWRRNRPNLAKHHEQLCADERGFENSAQKGKGPAARLGLDAEIPYVTGDQAVAVGHTPLSPTTARFLKFDYCDISNTEPIAPLTKAARSRSYRETRAFYPKMGRACAIGASRVRSARPARRQDCPQRSSRTKDADRCRGRCQRKLRQATANRACWQRRCR